MCVILVSPHGETFDVEELRAAQYTNSDGVGVAWRLDSGLVAYRKFAQFEESKWRQPRGACIVHFRLATAGGNSVEMAHPFPVTRSAGVRRWGQAKRLLFHNGHIPGWEYDAKEVLPRKLRTTSGPWSDSRLLAYCAHRFGEKHLGTMAKDWHQRVAIFDNESIATYGDWDETIKDGILRSNIFHRTTWGMDKTTAHWSQRVGWENWSDWDDIPIRVNDPVPYNNAGVYMGAGYAEPPLRLTSGGNPAALPEPSEARGCCSFDVTHVEHLCLHCNEVICPNCHSWGACLTHASVRLEEVTKHEGYAG